MWLDSENFSHIETKSQGFMRRLFIKTSIFILLIVGGVSYFWTPALYSLILFLPPIFLGISDISQKRQAIRRNFPVLGHFRYLLEEIRPEIQQYFIETNEDGMPFSREARSLIYQRAKKVRDTIPFGTQRNLYANGTEWINHSFVATHPRKEETRVKIGGKDCKKPYLSSLINISAMSYGSLSKNAVLALNKGAQMGGFAHNTGEGGITPHHRQNGGDLIWQIGTSYFGCRNPDGSFNLKKFTEKSQEEQVKMIEIKISQGAKPGHGGILPGSKVTAEIARIRDVEIGKDVISPPSHSVFSNPIELTEWITTLREASGGKPVGIKVCIGKRREFFSICKAMVKTGVTPDYIAVDGAEGGTGAAPLEFSNSIGTPLSDALIFVHNALTGIGLRDQVKIIASGKISTGFHMATKIALGADLIYCARAMMFAVGCIQALRCNANNCPTGVATQNKELMAGLDIEDKSKRVKNFHCQTIRSFLEVLSAAGLNHPSELEPWHIQRRISAAIVKHYGEIYPYIENGSLLSDPIPSEYARAWAHSSAEKFSV